MKQRKLPRTGIIFVTGTDTGVGKTVVTALLLLHLRAQGVRALGMKPFCSGSREDVQMLRAIQGDELPAPLLNPFYFEEPVAPWLAAKNLGRTIRLSQAIRRIHEAKQRCDLLLVEGAGGLLSPLGCRFTALDLITELRSDVIVVAPNRIGCVGQVLLTTQVLKHAGILSARVVLIGQKTPDKSAQFNTATFREWAPGNPAASVPYLPNLGTRQRGKISSDQNKLKYLLHDARALIQLVQFF